MTYYILPPTDCKTSWSEASSLTITEQEAICTGTWTCTSYSEWLPNNISIAATISRTSKYPSFNVSKHADT